MSGGELGGGGGGERGEGGGEKRRKEEEKELMLVSFQAYLCPAKQSNVARCHSGGPAMFCVLVISLMCTTKYHFPHISVALSGAAERCGVLQFSPS